VTGPADCRLIGSWRITAADLWDDGYLDLVAPAWLRIDGDGHGAFAFGVVQAVMEVSYGRSIVFFRWRGSDEGDEISGDGSAEIQDDGTLEIELSFHNGDEATLIARPKLTSSTAC
jgi:hypothetical protein